MAERLSREEIEIRLKDVPKHLVVGFAVRVATYILPTLSRDRDKKEFLWSWTKKDSEARVGYINTASCTKII